MQRPKPIIRRRQYPEAYSNPRARPTKRKNCIPDRAVGHWPSPSKRPIRRNLRNPGTTEPVALVEATLLLSSRGVLLIVLKYEFYDHLQFLLQERWSKLS